MLYSIRLSHDAFESSGSLPATQGPVWAESLVEFLTCATPSELKGFLSQAATGLANFQVQMRDSGYRVFTTDLESQWSNWACSEVGAQCIQDLTTTVLSLLEEFPWSGFSGRGKRETLTRLPYAGLHHLAQHAEQDYRLLLLPMACLHQLGELAHLEMFKMGLTSISDKSAGSLRFEIARQVLILYPQLPESLANHLLHSVAELNIYKSSNSVFDSGLQSIISYSKLGAFGLTSQLAFDLGACRLPLHCNGSKDVLTDIPPPFSQEDHSWPHHLEYDLRNLRNGLESSSDPELVWQRVVMGRFLWLGLPIEWTAKIFAPELGRERSRSPVTTDSKRALPREVWSAIRKPMSAQEQRDLAEMTRNKNVFQLARELAEPAGARSIEAPVRKSERSPWSVIHKCLDDMDPSDSDRFRTGLAYVLRERDAHEAREKRILRTYLERYPAKTVMGDVARFVQKQAQSGMPNGSSGRLAKSKR